VLYFANETKFYRQYLRISYEFGSHLRKAGFLEPDAAMEDGRPLFLCDLHNLSRHRQGILNYRAHVQAARHNLKAA
jgi:hypothetical protein